MCKIIQTESAFNKLKRNKDKVVGLAKSCKGCNLGMYANKKEAFDLQHQHLSIRKNDSKITHLWKVVYDYKRHNCIYCRKEKAAREFVIYIYIYIYISKYNPKIPKDVKTVMITVEKKKKYLKEGI